MRRFLATVAACVVAGVASSIVLAQPSIPATFYGSVTVDGAPAAAGSEVRGFVNGADCSQSAPGQRLILREGETSAYVLYVVHETQRPGCAREGSTVTFTINGEPALQSATWKPGPLRLDLSRGSAPPIPLPSPTGTIAAALQTAAGTLPADGTSPPLSRPSGTPPTDDVRFDQTPKPPEFVDQEASTDNDDGGSSALAWILGGLGIIALAAGVAGYLYARRPRGPSAGDSA